MIPDVLVVGGGAFGLSVAFSVRRAGHSVRVLEGARIGAGASGGPVGALAPHAPGRWSDLHAFQLAALAALPGRIADIEADSGIATGYARRGRLIPLGDAGSRSRAEAAAAAAPGRWGAVGEYRVLDAPPPGTADWIAINAVQFGIAHDTISARIEPRAYLMALAASLPGAVSEGIAVRGVDPEGPTVLTEAGPVAAGTVVLAAGWQNWGLISPLAPRLAGTAVKGQAALLGMDTPERPLVTQSGLYVVPHERGVAIGSTSEQGVDDPHATDEALDRVIARARATCPALAGVPVIRRWAGLRPRPPGRVPVVGPLLEHPRIFLAGGGFRIGLGIAHAVGDAVAAEITGRPAAIPLPASFRPAS